MAYTVLARKYRSRTFEEVIGQEPVATTLVNAIKSDRIHHGYLFTGTRGVGKTSMARILAKALNCLSSDAATAAPCCECDACRAIAEGDDVDVIEIDAASNTGVDNIRELRSNTAYRPARCRYKVYIIDEVHMLSTGAFNALLKTLEEPPDHVKFILATTEIQKVPATIRSRCQNFNFRNIGPDAIAKRLGEIVTEEGASAENVVVQRIARLANGSMRDALSILDQLLSVSPEKLDAAVLDEILPPAQDERIFKLLDQAAGGDVAAVLTELDGILAGGRGLEVFCNDAIEVVRALMIVRTCGADTAMVDLPAGAQDEYVRLAGQFEVSHYVQMIAMLEELRRNVRYSGAGRALTEALIVRFANMRSWSSIEQLLAQLPADATAGDQKKKSSPHVAERGRPVRTSESVEATTSASVQPPAAGGSPPVVPAGISPSAVSAGASPAVEPREHPSQPAVARRGPVEPASAAELSAPENIPLDDLPPETQIPDDYHPEECQPDESQPTAPLASAADRSKVEADPVVQRTMDLFDGILLDVRRAASPPAGSKTE